MIAAEPSGGRPISPDRIMPTGNPPVPTDVIEPDAPTDVGVTISPGVIARTLAMFVDALLPGDDLFPSAALVGVQGRIADELRRRDGADAVTALVTTLRDSGLTEKGDAAARRAAVAAFEHREPALFAFCRTVASYAYYAQPAVIAAVRSLGHVYNDAPQPLGYDLAPFDPEINLPKQRRGSYKATGDVGR